MSSPERRLELIATALFAVVGCVAFVLALGFPPASRIVPMMVSVAIVAAAVLQAVTLSTRRSEGDDKAGDGPPKEDPESGAGLALLLAPVSRKRTLIIAGLAVFLVVLIPLVGYPLAVGIFLIVALTATSRRPHWAPAVFSLVGFGLTYSLFVLMLDLEPFDGLLFAWM